MIDIILASIIVFLVICICKLIFDNKKLNFAKGITKKHVKNSRKFNKLLDKHDGIFLPTRIGPLLMFPNDELKSKFKKKLKKKHPKLYKKYYK